MKRLPAILARMALPVLARRAEQRMENQYSDAERAAVAALRASGGGLEFEIRIVANALAKVRGLAYADAIARVRAGVVLAIGDRSISSHPTRDEVVRAAWRGNTAAERVARQRRSG